MKKTKAKRLLAALLCATALLALAQPCYAKGEAEDRIIRVGWYETGGDALEGTAGSHGYDYEYLQALSQYIGWSYEYVSAPWDDCLEKLKRGEIDIMGFVARTEERELEYGFPDLPMATVNAWLVVNSDGGSATGAESEAVIDGETVGMVKGSAYNKFFTEYCQKRGISINYVEYGSHAELAPALKSGEIAAAVVSDEDMTSAMRGLLRLSPQNRYYATNINDTELLHELEDAMVQLNTYCPDINSDLNKKYLSTSASGQPIFSAAEQQFIKDHQNVLVLYDSGWPPIEYYDENAGGYAGVSPMLFKLLSEKCGINFVYEGSTSGQVLSELQSDDATNVVTTISYDYEWAEKHNVYITQPFITSAIVKLGKDPDAENPTVAINENAYFTYLLKDELKGVSTLHFAKQEQRLEAVRKGAADYTFVTEDQANYYRSIPKYASLKMERLAGYEQKVCISVGRNSDPALISIISKSLSSITHDEMTAIIVESTVNPYKLTFSDWLYKNAYAIAVAVIAVAALCTVSAAKMRVDRSKRMASEQASRAKSEFLSHVSHDIRTPLNAIIGITSLAIEERDAAIKQDYLYKINESGKYLLGLINDTLDMSKIESGKMTLHYEAVQYKTIYDVIMTVIGPKAAEKKLMLRCDLDGIGDEYVMADKLRIEQILLNLLNNAVKFTPENGSVACTVSAFERDGERIRYRITVADTGVGMSKEFMGKLFVPFEQERNRLSVENAGTGLGLSIVKSLVDMMGGSISCTSEKNEGTKFTLELSCLLASPEEIRASAAERVTVDDTVFEGKLVLLAEDNSMNTLVAEKLLEKKGIKTVCVQNGKEAVEAFCASRQGGFDAILMDIHMPVMDGLEASGSIRGSGHPDAARIPIIALSANAYDEDRKECMSSGMNDHVAKPIEPELLFGALRRAFQHSEK